MAFLAAGYWFEVDPEPTETPGETGEVSPIPDGTAEPTVDPDFIEVSDFLNNEGATASPAAEKTEIKQQEQTSETQETEAIQDYIERLDNISVQIGVLDICVVLSLLISIVQKFIRVPR